MNKIIIVGSNSYIAKQLINRLKIEETSFITGSSRFDKSDLKLDLEKYRLIDLNKINKNDLVIFLAAISSPDLCQKDFKKSFKINVLGTIKFIEESIRRNANVLFFSSDTVYGTENGQMMRMLFLQNQWENTH